MQLTPLCRRCRFAIKTGNQQASGHFERSSKLALIKQSTWAHNSIGSCKLAATKRFTRRNETWPGTNLASATRVSVLLFGMRRGRCYCAIVQLARQPNRTMAAYLKTTQSLNWRFVCAKEHLSSADESLAVARRAARVCLNALEVPLAPPFRMRQTQHEKSTQSNWRRL